MALGVLAFDLGIATASLAVSSGVSKAEQQRAWMELRGANADGGGLPADNCTAHCGEWNSHALWRRGNTGAPQVMCSAAIRWGMGCAGEAHP